MAQNTGPTLFQSNAHIPETKNPFFQNFFYSLAENDLRELFAYGEGLFSHQTRNPVHKWGGGALGNPSNIEGSVNPRRRITMNRELRTTNLEPQSPNFSALCHIRLKIRANPRKPRLIFSELPTPNSLCLKPNFRKAKMNINSVITKDYENE